MNLEPVPLVSLAAVRSGAGAPQEAAAFGTSGLPFVRAGSLPKLLDGAGEGSLEKIEPEVANQYGLKVFPAGTVLFAKSGMSATKGYVYRLRGPAYVVNHLAALVPHDFEDAAFLERALQRFSPTVLIRDSAYPSIRLREIESMKVFAPRESVDRRRIAEILDKADALRAKRRAALAQLDTFTQSMFLDMFGDPVTNPKEMCKLPLGDLIKLKSGEFLPATEMVDSGPYSVLGGNGINGFHDRYMFEDPQIVIGRVGVYCGCVHASPPKSWVTDNALYVSKWSPKLRFEYLLHALTHARLNQYASQSGQPLVSGSRIYPVAILVPPEELQLAFEVRIASMGKLKRLYDAAIAKVDVLFAALQHRAFQGGL